MVEAGESARGIDCRRHGVCEHASPRVVQTRRRALSTGQPLPLSKAVALLLTGRRVFGEGQGADTSASAALADVPPPSPAGFAFLGSRLGLLLDATRTPRQCGIAG